MSSSNSIFAEVGFRHEIDRLKKQIQEIYRADNIPWFVGYSGGKDSSATLQLVWQAIRELPELQRHKQIYVITNDTLVENPIVSLWVDKSLKLISRAAQTQGLPFEAHKLEPDVGNTFWVKLIGWGYPAPRHKFRWCTHRLKIEPTSRFIQQAVRRAGEAIVVLGTRKAESAARAKVIDSHRPLKGVEHHRDFLSQHSNLANAWIYPVIANWTNDDVWTYLMQEANPWGHSNKELLNLYRGATADGECPMILDTETPSCGNSRFGCWTCTLVDKDRSMAAMIHNDEQKEWMLPLLAIRDLIDFRVMEGQSDRSVRDFRRMNGRVQLVKGEPVPGPYLQSFRGMILRKVLEAQEWIRENGPEEVRGLELITLEELREIRRIWIEEKHEIEDLLPGIYQESTGKPFPDARHYDLIGLGAEEMKILKECCEDNEIHYQMIRELLHIEKEFRLMSRRAGLFEKLERAISRGFYESAEDAREKVKIDFFEKENLAKAANSNF